MNIVEFKAKNTERPMSWRKPAPDGGLTAKQCERALWIIALALLLVVLGSMALRAQDKPKANGIAATMPVADKASEAKPLPDSVQIDELTQLKLASYFKDLTIADQSAKLSQQAFKDAQAAGKEAQELLQKEFDAFLSKEKLKKEDWAFDPGKWGWQLVNKKALEKKPVPVVPK